MIGRGALAFIPVNDAEKPSQGLSIVVFLLAVTFMIAALYFVRVKAMTEASLYKKEISDRYTFLTSILYAVFVAGFVSYVTPYIIYIFV